MKDGSSLLQSGLCYLFAKIYRSWLWNDFYETYDRVLYVFDWRTAKVASVGKSGKEISPRLMQPCFWIFR